MLVMVMLVMVMLVMVMMINVEQPSLTRKIGSKKVYL